MLTVVGEQGDISTCHTGGCGGEGEGGGRGEGGIDKHLYTVWIVEMGVPRVKEGVFCTAGTVLTGCLYCFLYTTWIVLRDCLH